MRARREWGDEEKSDHTVFTASFSSRDNPSIDCMLVCSCPNASIAKVQLRNRPGLQTTWICSGRLAHRTTAYRRSLLIHVLREKLSSHESRTCSLIHHEGHEYKRREGVHTFCKRAFAPSSAMRWCRTHRFSEREIRDVIVEGLLLSFDGSPHVSFSGGRVSVSVMEYPYMRNGFFAASTCIPVIDGWPSEPPSTDFKGLDCGVVEEDASALNMGR